jgi:hypothetical protein
MHQNKPWARIINLLHMLSSLSQTHNKKARHLRERAFFRGETFG